MPVEASPPELSRDPVNVAVGAGRVLARLTRQVELALTGVDLSLPQYRVLVFLAEVDQLPSGVLAGALRVKPPSVTGIVDGLVGRGLVERCTDDADRRRVAARLTAAGRRTLRAAESAIAGRLVELAGHLDPPESTAVWDGLGCWGRALDAARAGSAPS